MQNKYLKSKPNNAGKNIEKSTRKGRKKDLKSKPDNAERRQRWTSSAPHWTEPEKWAEFNFPLSSKFANCQIMLLLLLQNRQCLLNWNQQWHVLAILDIIRHLYPCVNIELVDLKSNTFLKAGLHALRDFINPGGRCLVSILEIECSEKEESRQGKRAKENVPMRKEQRRYWGESECRGVWGFWQGEMG